MGITLDSIVVYLLAPIVLLIVEISRFIKAKRSKRKFFCLKEFFVIMFQVYLALLISVTLFPLMIDDRKVNLIVNFIPIVNSVKDLMVGVNTMGFFMVKFWIINILGNIILLSPLAFIVPVISKRFRSLKSVVLLCFCTSCFIEFLQFLSLFIGNLRSIDIDDVILNTLGAFIGFGAFKVLSRFSFFKNNMDL
ncbi:MAG: VanZ family protein [Clostridium sp.]